MQIVVTPLARFQVTDICARSYAHTVRPESLMALMGNKHVPGRVHIECGFEVPLDAEELNDFVSTRTREFEGWLIIGEPSVVMTILAAHIDAHLVDESKVRLRISPMKGLDTSMIQLETDQSDCRRTQTLVAPEDIIVMSSVRDTFEHVPLDLISGSRTEYLVALEKVLNRLTDARTVSTNAGAIRESVALLGAVHGDLSGENSLATVDKGIVSQMTCFSRLVEIAKFKS